MKDKLMINKGIFLLCLMIINCIYSCVKDDIDTNDIYKTIYHNMSAYKKIPEIKSNVLKFKNNEQIFENTRNDSLHVLLKEVVDKDVEVKGSIVYDIDLLAAYDSIYRTKSTILPAGILKLSNQGIVKIKSNQLKSEIGFQFELDNTKDFTLASGVYVFTIPVKMEPLNKNVSLKSNLMFVRYTLVVDDFLLKVVNVIKNASEVEDGNEIKYLKVESNYSLDFDLEIELNLANDQDLANYYNKEYGTNFEPFPNNSFSLSTKNIKIAANKIESDTVELLINNNLLEDYHILGIKVSSKIHTNSDQVFYQKIIPSNIYKENYILTGEVIDRSNWSASGEKKLHFSSFIFDGNFESSFPLRLPGYIIIDMGEEHLVKGFQYYSNYDFNDMNILEANVESSLDGQKWDLVGKYKDNSGIIDHKVRNIHFISPVKGRFFKFIILKSSFGEFGGLSELFGIK